MSTNVPHPNFTNVGVSSPSESDILAGLLLDFRAAFGTDINSSPATPQGQLMASLAAILGANNDLFAEYVNQVDPAYADGRMQDAIARIYYLSRIVATPTTVECTCSGAFGTVIEQGALAQATDGTVYQNTGNVTIGVSGSVTATFQSITAGAIVCAAGTLTKIYRLVPGWDSITNPSDGTPGRDTETRAEFEARRSLSVAGNATGIVPAIRGALLNVSGVIDAYVIENATNAAVTAGGVSVAAHSIYAAVYGGTDDDVAAAILSRKPPGCGYTGNTTVTVTDSGSGYSLPYPSYDVTFERPTGLPIYFAISIANNQQVPSDAETQIRNAVIAAFSGDDGGQRAKIGATIFALRFVSAISALGSWAQVISITVGTAASPTDADLTPDINQMPTITAADIAVTVAS